MSRTFLREWFNFLRAADGFSGLVDRSSCAGQSFFLRDIGYPTHGICGRQTEQRKNEGWQDRLPPVLGATCNALPLDKHSHGRSNVTLVDKHSHVDRDPVAYSGDVIDQITENIANCRHGTCV
jgi:hypothetical protein